jgi:hypothetical protein
MDRLTESLVVHFELARQKAYPGREAAEQNALSCAPGRQLCRGFDHRSCYSHHRLDLLNNAGWVDRAGERARYPSQCRAAMLCWS